MNRREFIMMLGGAAAWPLVARAQQSEQLRRIGLLAVAPDGDRSAQAQVGALRQALRELGWVEGRNLHIEYRWPGDDAKRLLADASELVGLKPELIVASGALAGLALIRVTSSMPIVQVMGADPVALGFVTNIPNPTGNITGFFAQEPTLSGKWLEVLKEIMPAMSRAMILLGAESPNTTMYLPGIEAAAEQYKVVLTKPELKNDADIRNAIAEFAGAPNAGLVVLPGAFTGNRRALIITQAAQHHLPAVYPFPNFVDEGGLVSFGIDPIQLFRSSASYVDRILKGAKPSELPVQLPSKFELNINLKTAKALGLTIPESFLVRADRVIE